MWYNCRGFGEIRYIFHNNINLCPVGKKKKKKKKKHLGDISSHSKAKKYTDVSI